MSLHLKTHDFEFCQYLNYIFFRVFRKPGLKNLKIMFLNKIKF